MLSNIPELDVVGEAALADFGGLSGCHRVQRVIPRTARALALLVEWARETGTCLMPRTLGLSQSGQSIPASGVSVDMAAFVGIEVRADRVRCGAAVTWRQLVTVLAAVGKAPEVVPFNLDLSIGGTLSAGGMGSTSHRYGMAASSVESLEVVTGAGEFLVASRTSHPDVLDAFLGGVGAFGAIVAVTLRLRSLAARVETRFFLYHRMDRMLADQQLLVENPACTHVEGFASAAIQGMRLVGGRRVPFARWFYGLQVSRELGPASTPDDSWAAQLQFDELVHDELADSLEHASRYDPRFRMMKGSGLWEQPHPWLECMFPHDRGVELLPELVPRLPLALGDGHRILMMADVARPRLLMQPEGAPVLGLALLPAGVPAAMLDAVMPALRDVHEQCIAVGGKRYLSGWLFEPDEAAWRQHYGSEYETWKALKMHFDPDGIFRSRLLPFNPTWT